MAAILQDPGWPAEDRTGGREGEAGVLGMQIAGWGWGHIGNCVDAPSSGPDLD